MRADLVQYPSILIELGNMKNATEAAQMQSEAGRARCAGTVTRGITTYLSETASAR